MILDLLILNSWWNLDNLLTGTLTFWDLDGVGNKQWGGSGGPPSSKLITGHF